MGRQMIILVNRFWFIFCFGDKICFPL